MSRKQATNKGQRLPTPADNKMGKKLRAMRDKRGVTQQQLGTELGISYQQVQKYELGITRLSVARLADIAKALNEPIESFLQVEPNIDFDSLLKTVDKPAVHMLSAFHRIADKATQRKMVELVETVADAQV